MTNVFKLRYLTALCGLSLTTQAFAQDVEQCALTCIANVDGTSCSQSQWQCLCANEMYVERMNNCTVASCNAAQQEATFQTIAQLCAIFSVTLTAGPEATVSLDAAEAFSTVAIPTQSSLPSVITAATNPTAATTSEYVPGPASFVSMLSTNAVSPSSSDPWNFSTISTTAPTTIITTPAGAPTLSIPNEAYRSYSPWIWTLISSLALANMVYG